MKKIFRVLLIIIVVLVVLVGILASYIALRSIPKYDVEKINVKVESTPARVAQGTKLASMLCRNCHYNEATQKFTGKELKEAPQFGTIHSANLPQEPIAGLGKWSNGDIINLLGSGIKTS